MKSFKEIPVEKDTKIIREQEIIVKKIPAVHQKWSWDNIIAESIIFHTEDIDDLTDNELLEIVKNCPTDKYSFEPHSQHTLKRSPSGFTFVNFNFVVADDLFC